MSLEKPGLNDDMDGQQPKPNYFIRHWRGQLSLPVSYWVNGVLCVVVSAVVIGIFALATRLLENARGVPILLALVGLLALLIALAVWQIVGIWRSAMLHEERGGFATVWANVAKFIVIMSALGAIVPLGTTFTPIAFEHLEIALGDKRFSESQFRILRDGTELEFSGGINFGDARRLERALTGAPKATVLHVNSHGGRLVEADQMAEMVQARNLTTYVHTACESACTHIFLAGRERWLGQNARLGFHRPSSGFTWLEADELVAQERKFLRSKNFPESFITKALQTKPESMWHPAHSELLALRAISGIADRNKFAMSGSSTSMTSDRMTQILSTIPMYAALKEHEPAIYEDVLRILNEGFQRGSSEEEVASKGRAIIGKIVARKLSYAAENLILESADIYITYMSGLRKADPASCVGMFDNTKGVPLVADLKSLFPEASAKELDLNTRVLRLKVDSSTPKLNDPKADAYLGEVIDKLQKQPGMNLDVMGKEKLLPAEYAAYCDTATAFVTEVRRLPPGKAAAVFREIFTALDK